MRPSRCCVDTPHVQWTGKDQGQTHAINKGLLQARGELSPTSTARTSIAPAPSRPSPVFFAENPDAQIVVGNCDIIDAQSQVTGNFKAVAGGLTDLVQYWRWGELHCTPQQSVFFRRTVLAEIGLFIAW